MIVVNGTLNSRLGSNNCTSPNDFLALLKNATVVITNSFHGIALSLIFHRDFFVFMPQAHKDRIYNLLNLYGLQGRIVTNDYTGENISEINYLDMDIISNNMRNKALTYLKEALS